MSSDEWVFQQWLARNGGKTSAVLPFLPAAEIGYLRDLDMNSILPVDLLAFCLGYTCLADTRHVLQVCKSWYAATRKRHFWKRRIDAKLKQVAAALAPNDKQKADMVLRFDTFSCPGETLQNQVEFTFRGSSWFRIYEWKCYVAIERYVTNKWDDCACNNYLPTGELFSTSREHYAESTRVTCDEVIVFPGMSLKRNTWRKSEPSDILFTRRDGGMYQGNGAYVPASQLCIDGVGVWKDGDGREYPWKDDCLVPHGDGKWTFADGTVLEGRGVAWRGEPRWPAPPSFPTRPQKRRRRQK